MKLLLALLAAALPALAQAASYRLPLDGCDAPAGCQPQTLNRCYITAYMDHEGKDWNCGTWQYDGHQGTDFGVGGVYNQRAVVAAADGRVVQVNDGCDDHNSSLQNCSCGGGFGNFVKLLHSDGQYTIYGHMAKGSVAVSLNQQVSCGTLLGKVASSGCSTGPHLHFEVVDPTYGSDDPFSGTCGGPLSYWADQGDYCGLPGEGGCEAVGSDGASFVNETIPDGTQVASGSAFTKTWTMRNSGTTTWNAADGYRWAFSGGEQFGAPASVALATDEEIAPGETKTWSVSMSAPSASGNHTGYWRMQRNGSFFGDEVWVQVQVPSGGLVNDAAFVSETIPDDTRVGPGAAFTKTWTLRNSGTTTWTSSGGYRFAFDHEQRFGAAALTALDAGESISPGETKTWSVALTAPTAPGTYRGYWQMDHASDGRFGVLVWVQVVVNAPSSNDADGDGVTSTASGGRDCNDSDPNVYPGCAERCDGVDNDCDGTTDEGLTRACADPCPGIQRCASGSWGACDGREPQSESCNGADDDCDDKIDENASCQDGYSCRQGMCRPVGQPSDGGSTPEEDAGVRDGGEGSLGEPIEGGCACAAGGAQPVVAMATLLAAAALSRRRRR